jgi:glutathione-specific gamma-glutamylcyclotransferase
MWIFGYGSLMFDGWEAACGCIDRKWANLPGYRRSFNKKSVESRGTRATPGLTLNLARAEGEICRGIAFAFEDNDQTQKILRGLEKREACKPRALRVQLEEGKEVTAQVFIYEGHNLIGSMPVPGKADMVVKAAGIRGTNFERGSERRWRRRSCRDGTLGSRQEASSPAVKNDMHYMC